MKLKICIFITTLAVSLFSQNADLTNTNNTETGVLPSLSSSSEKNSQVYLSEFNSARTISTTGAVLFGGGIILEVFGTVVMISSLSQWASNSNRQEVPSLRGAGLIITGACISFAGNITACAGGGKARNILRSRDMAYPNFSGWGLFWGGFGLSIAGSIFQNIAPIPALILSAGGMGLSIGSVVHSVSYANKAYYNQLGAGEFKLAPVVMTVNDHTAYGLKFSMGF